MIGEEAYYYRILLQNGFSDEYNEWLNKRLEEEDPLSDIVLELSFCSSDLNKTVSLLLNFAREKGFDSKVVCEKLRLFLKEAYHSHKMSNDEVISYMYTFACDYGDLDADSDAWESMYDVTFYYDLADGGVMDKEKVDSAFHAYLDYGIPIDSNVLWIPKKAHVSLWSRIKSRFAK